MSPGQEIIHGRNGRVQVPKALAPGTRVRVQQGIELRDGMWTSTVEGVVVRHCAQKTGSWFAGGKDDKLWLNRLHLRKADGEETILTLDDHSRVTILDADS